MNLLRSTFSFRAVNLLSIRKSPSKFKIPIIFVPPLLLFIFYNNNIALFSANEQETKEVFRSKNLLTDSKNLSETQVSKSLQDEQMLRRSVVESACQRNQDKLKSPQEKVTMLSDPQFNLGYCNIPKIATSSWYCLPFNHN